MLSNSRNWRSKTYTTYFLSNTTVTTCTMLLKYDGKIRHNALYVPPYWTSLFEPTKKKIIAPLKAKLQFPQQSWRSCFGSIPKMGQVVDSFKVNT